NYQWLFILMSLCGNIEQTIVQAYHLVLKDIAGKNNLSDINVDDLAVNQGS
ncbi:unnamed protein product, partial [Rotaria sp. Silwood1]